MFSFRRKTRPDRHQFEAEAIPHLDSLYNSALYMTKNDRDAEDLVQETMLKAFRFYDKYEKGTNIRAWLFKILTNTFINQYRRKVVSFEYLDNLDYPIEPHQHDDGVIDRVPYDRLLESMELSESLSDPVIAALEKLSLDFRLVVILADLQDFSYKEIAEILNCPVGTVMSRLYRGRKMLQKSLAGYARQRGIIPEASETEESEPTSLDAYRQRKRTA